MKSPHRVLRISSSAGQNRCFCHGKTTPPDLTAFAEESWPQERTRGYGPGEIRGAFNVTRPAQTPAG